MIRLRRPRLALLAQLAPTGHMRRPIIGGARPAVAAAGSQFAAVLQVFKLPLRVLAATLARERGDPDG